MSLGAVIALVAAVLGALAVAFGLGGAQERRRSRGLKRDGEKALQASLERHDREVEEKVHDIESIRDPDAFDDAARSYGREVLAEHKARLKRRFDD